LEQGYLSAKWDLTRRFNSDFIAQDFEKVIPELVKLMGKAIKSIDYVKMMPLLVEAIKDQATSD